MQTKSKTGWKAFLVLISLLLLLLVTSQVASQIITTTGDMVGTETGLTDMAFFSGEERTVTVASTDDVFAAGGKVNVVSTSADHLVVAGGEISAKDINVKDVFAAGGNLLFLDGNISDDVIAVGGEVSVRPGVKIGGSAIISGAEVKIEAPIGAELRSAASRLYLNNTITGNAQLMGDNVELGPKARIGGNLQYRAKTLKISPDAVITGTKSILPADKYSEYERWGKDGAASIAFFAVAFVLGLALLVVVIAFFFPALMTSSAAMIRENPWRALLIGLLITLLLPFTIFLLSVSIIGIPIAMLIAAIFLAAVPIAIAATAYFAGMLGRWSIAKKPDDSRPSVAERLLWPVAAVVALLILGSIPLIGWLFWLFALMFGMGAVVSRGGAALARKA